MHLRQWLLLAPLLVVASGASAALYVTDSVTVGIFATPDLQGEPESRLHSGTLVDVIEKRGELLKVRTEHGEQGWLRSHFLIKREPAVLQLEGLKQELVQLESTLEVLQGENAALKKNSTESMSVTVLRAELDKLRKQNEALVAQPVSVVSAAPLSVDDQVNALQVELDTLRNEKGDVEQRLAAALLIDGAESDFDGTADASFMNIEVKLLGVIVVLISGLLLGAGLTYRWIDRRLLKRFGGIRFH